MHILSRTVPGLSSGGTICTRMNQFEKDLPLHLFSLRETHSALFDDDLSDMVEAKGSFYLVHNDDVENIHEISNLIRKKCPLGKNVGQKACQMLKEKLISEYFQSHSSQMNTYGDKKLYCRWSLHSLICPLGTTHVSSSYVHNIILGENENEEGSHPVQILSKDKFDLFISFIIELQGLLFEDGKEEVVYCSKEIKEMFATQFPKVQLKDGEVLIQPSECPKKCFHAGLLNSTTNSTLQKDKNEKKERFLMEEVDVNKGVGIAFSSETSDAKSSTDETYSIKVYEFNNSTQRADFDFIKSTMEKLHSNVDENSVTEKSGSSLRRSSRTRNKSIVSPTILELNKDSILANLILTIDEDYSHIRLTNQKLFLFQYDEISKIGEMYDLSDYEDKETIRYILDQKNQDDSNIEIILTETEIDEKMPKRKREEDEEYRRNELLELVIGDFEVNGDSMSSKRRRSEERGFQGTFLQSSIF